MFYKVIYEILTFWIRFSNWLTENSLKISSCYTPRDTFISAGDDMLVLLLEETRFIKTRIKNTNSDLYIFK